ncbi:MAG TPA: sulfatase-like hydrolase/transferase [Candidatus Brocadiia bacterium]|nr:sulfatase-like hydrolase/transferase [Candidatus Brocadiia bacterium]
MSNPINRRRFLQTCAAGAAAAALPSSVASAADDAAKSDRPNIIVFLADDLGYECIGANGGESYKTPNLDTLAQTGIRFEHCYSQPLCTPSRVQILTGRYNNRNYVRFGLLDWKEKTFGNMLRDAGYATCAAGKWQLSGENEAPGHFGFDEYCLWQLAIRGQRYANPTLTINGKVHAFPGRFGPDIVCDFATDFISRNGARPFLIYYPMMLTHAPYVPTPDGPDWHPERESDQEKGGKNKYFGDMVSYMDKIVGRVVSHLEKLGLREKTLILFTGDNGTGRGIVSRFKGRDVPGEKSFTTDGGTHVPLICNCPGMIPGGRVTQDLVDFTDFLPTLAEAAGASLPSGVGIDGHSFAPQMRGAKGNPREWVYCWYEARQKLGDDKKGEFARNQRHKLYIDGRFYDVPADPFEQKDLAKSDLGEEARAARAGLQKVLDGMTPHIR